jgi:hypothetical protein
MDGKGHRFSCSISKFEATQETVGKFLLGPVDSLRSQQAR